MNQKIRKKFVKTGELTAHSLIHFMYMSELNIHITDSIFTFKSLYSQKRSSSLWIFASYFSISSFIISFSWDIFSLGVILSSADLFSSGVAYCVRVVMGKVFSYRVAQIA